MQLPGINATTNTLTGITGCSGAPANGAAVTLVIPTLDSLQVASFGGFDLTGGQFTATGLNGTCTYSSFIPLLNEIDGITGCNGTVADKAAVQFIGCAICALPTILPEPPIASSFAQGVYQWHALVPLVPNAPGYWVPVFTSGPIFPTSPSDGEYFLLTANTNIPQTLTAGLYKYDSSTLPKNGGWVSETGTEFPEIRRRSKGDFFQLTEHYFLADGISGAGGDKDKVSIAGALGLNIISDHTSATFGPTETVHAGHGRHHAQRSEQRRGLGKGRLRCEVRQGGHRCLGRA